MNWAKWRTISSSVSALLARRGTPYCLHMVSPIVRFVINLPVQYCSDGDLFEISRAREAAAEPSSGASAGADGGGAAEPAGGKRSSKGRSKTVARLHTGSLRASDIADHKAALSARGSSASASSRGGEEPPAGKV